MMPRGFAPSRQCLELIRYLLNLDTEAPRSVTVVRVEGSAGRIRKGLRGDHGDRGTSWRTRLQAVNCRWCTLAEYQGRAGYLGGCNLASCLDVDSLPFPVQLFVLSGAKLYLYDTNRPLDSNKEALGVVCRMIGLMHLIEDSVSHIAAGHRDC